MRGIRDFSDSLSLCPVQAIHSCTFIDTVLFIHPLQPLVQFQQAVALVNVQCLQVENDVRNNIPVQVSLHTPFAHHQHRGEQPVCYDGLP